MKYGYIRVSSDEQKNTGLSLEAQKQELINNAVPINNVYVDEAKSGGLKDDDLHFVLNPEQFKLFINLNKRPSFKKLLETMQPNDELLFTKWDRISRSVLFMELFLSYTKKKEIKLTPLKDTDNTLTMRIQAVISQNELDLTTKRNQDVQQALYQEGLYPYSTPYGYIRNVERKDGTLLYPNKKKGELIIHPKKAEIVKECFQIAIQSKKNNDNTLYKQILKKLPKSTYYAIIKRKTYTGMTTFNGEYKKTPYVPSIITEQTYNEANQ